MFSAKLIYKIRKAEGPLYATIKRFAEAILRFNVPAWKLVYVPMDRLRMLSNTSLRWFIQKVYYEPLFRTKCESCGKNLKIDIRIPQTSGHLRMQLGDHVTINGVNSFSSPSIYESPELSIGDYTNVGFQVSISVAERVSIGKHCLMAARVAIMDNNNHSLDPEKRKRLDKVSPEEISPVTIEDNVWIGYQAFIGKGVTIGEGSVVGANSVVLKDVPPYSIVLGCPARVVGLLKKPS